jgi:small subunit ribosomal protein S20
MDAADGAAADQPHVFPDAHRETHGPGGADVPRVMTRFIPPGSCLLTAEEQMFPILRDAAAGAETAFATAQPILDRFSARGLIHKNKAARRKSRLARRLNALG